MNISETIKLRGGDNGFQAKAVRSLIRSKTGIIVAPARSGKTIIMASAIDSLARGLKQKQFVLWLCNTKEQKAQAIAALTLLKELKLEGFFTAWIRCPSGVESNQSPVPMDRINLLIVDECHHASAPSWASIIESVPKNARRWGCTATPHRDDGQWAEVERLIGPIACKITPEEIRAAGYSTGCIYRFYSVGEKDWAKETVHEMAHDKSKGMSLFDQSMKTNRYRMVKGESYDTVARDVENQVKFRIAKDLCVENNVERNMVAAALAGHHIKMGRSTLIIVATVKQGQFIQEWVEGSKLVFSKMTVKEHGRRADIIQDFRDGKLKCLIATSLADEGLDVPCAASLILASGGRGISKELDMEGNERVSSRIEQRSARALTAQPGKEFAYLEDFWDHGHSMMLTHSKQRRKAYEELGFIEEKKLDVSSYGEDIFAQDFTGVAT